MSKYLLGTDPEMFLMDRDGNFVSAAGNFPGTKQEPYKIDKGAVQVDGTALEFNIDVARSEDEFFGNIRTVLAQIDEMIKGVDPDLKREFIPYATFDGKYFKELPDECKILGCDPDFNIQGQMNPNPGDFLFERPIRTAAGHIHIGWTEDEDAGSAGHFEDCRTVAEFFHKKAVFEPRTFAEIDRLRHYGMNGSFRPKKYGVELRSPSNLWLKSEKTIRETYRKVQAHMEMLG